MVFIGGLSRPGDQVHLELIRFISDLEKTLDKDEDTRPYLRLVFMPNYTTSKEFTFIPALDLNEQLICPGRKGCSL